MSSYNTIRDYFGNKEFKGSEIMQFSIMIVLGIFLISGGIIILQSEDIFNKIYEGFRSTSGYGNDGSETSTATKTSGDDNDGSEKSTATKTSGDDNDGSEKSTATNPIGSPRNRTPSSLTWTADLPEDLTLTSLQKNIKHLRKKSSVNIGLGWGMVAIGSMICLYQIYSLFFT
uniref:Uncharacterized protein n=1 Tax=viral metagenome TaxID=1070528 RepID=A0A6C0IEN0_9ZZZZ